MIQFNLLPSVKLEYVKARRNKRLAIMAASLVGGIAVAILVILFVSVQMIQKKYSEDLAADIKKQSQTLKSKTELNKILTIQNQLNNLHALHDQKPVTTQLFDYLKQFTPEKVNIGTANVDFATQTIVLTGSADLISTINKFVDTLKFTNYSVTYKQDEVKGLCAFLEISYNDQTREQVCTAFSEVVLTDFGRDEKEAGYKVTFKYDPAIFSNARKPTLVIPPGKITTRSETEKPSDKDKQNELFQTQSNQNGDNR
jgi:Tfp pilus assembly protein PilN